MSVCVSVCVFEEGMSDVLRRGENRTVRSFKGRRSNALLSGETSEMIRGIRERGGVNELMCNSWFCSETEKTSLLQCEEERRVRPNEGRMAMKVKTSLCDSEMIQGRVWWMAHGSYKRASSCVKVRNFTFMHLLLNVFHHSRHFLHMFKTAKRCVWGDF